MENKEIITIIDDQSKTRIASLEANVEVAYKYQGDQDFTKVLETTAYKGKVLAEDGKWPAVDETKQLVERKVSISPNNYPFYESRDFITVFKDSNQLIGGIKDEKFQLLNRKKTKEERKKAVEGALIKKLERINKK
jgi:hypothetical protein